MVNCNYDGVSYYSLWEVCYAVEYTDQAARVAGSLVDIDGRSARVERRSHREVGLVGFRCLQYCWKEHLRYSNQYIANQFTNFLLFSIPNPSL